MVEGLLATQPPMHLSGRCVCSSDPQFVEEKGIRAEDLVIGALESAFQECVSGAFGVYLYTIVTHFLGLWRESCV